MATKLKSNNWAGIWFWLKWILVAIAGFTGSMLFWNWLFFKQLNADFQNPQMAIGWLVAVFGTWFVTLIPLMKKKETVMGHMDKQDESTVAWWIIWISLTIGSFFLAVWFWTPFIAKHFGSIKNPTTSLIWVIAVFGTWLVVLIPLMIFMYQKVDKAYEDARIRRESRAAKFKDPVKIRAVFIEESKRQIPKILTDQLKKIPQTIKGGHLITAILKDGRKIEHVFIARAKEVLGIYGAEELTFGAQDISGFEPTDLTHPPDFTQKTWLRLDGNSA
jgi:hypothetical protein